MDDASIKVLLIEDSLFATRHMQQLLEEAKSAQFHAELKCADRLSVGLNELVGGGIDIVLLDLTLPDSFGLETFAKIDAQAPGVPVVVMYGLEDETIAMEAVRRGAQDYLVKSTVSSDLLKRAILYSIERKRAEQQIRGLNRELEQRLMELRDINRELETFSYSVSHDLRTPLRAIDGFSRILLNHHTDKLDEEGKRLLNIIRSNTDKMERLIDDLLFFSSSGRQEMHKRKIDMGQLAKEAFEELKILVPERAFQLEIKSLPPVLGDRSMIRAVFVNLLSNAIKFTGPKETAVVEVGGKAEDGENRYYVKDNGVGFDMRYAGKLFGVFQRLHSTDKFEGSGVGLAIVRRIIHRHGGRVRAEGKVGEGATFSFTLPIVEK